MASVKIASTSAGSSGGGSFSSGNINTVGASLLVALVSNYNGATEPTLADSKSNTWAPLTPIGNGSTNLRLYYVDSITPLVDAAQFVTVTGAGAFASVAFAAFSGSDTSPFDQLGTKATGTGTTADCASSPITPSMDGCALIAGIGFDSATSGLSIDDGLAVIEFLPYSGGNYLGVGLAWKEQATATAINPNFSWTTNDVTAALLASFKPGTGGGVGIVSRGLNVRQAVQRGSLY